MCICTIIRRRRNVRNTVRHQLTVSASVVVAFLAHALAPTGLERLAATGVLGAWFQLVLAIGAAGALDPVRGLGAPALGLTVGLPIAALVCPFFAAPSVRNAMLATPLPALITVNAIRIIPGAIFVALYAAGRLPASFGPSAGWGDIFAGVTALPLAWATARLGSRVRTLALLWNTIGIADLIAAIALGALSAPGPLQMFAGPPTSAIMTTLPWLIIPGFIVPILVFIHVVIFYRLAWNEASAARHVRLGAGQAKPT
jgi:hypothetical protein